MVTHHDRCSEGSTAPIPPGLNILSYAPQDARRVSDLEVADSLWVVNRCFRTHAVLASQSLRLNMVPPSLHIPYKQMHHEVLSMFFVVEFLEKKSWKRHSGD